jgi:hypothetical protein
VASVLLQASGGRSGGSGTAGSEPEGGTTGPAPGSGPMGCEQLAANRMIVSATTRIMALLPFDPDSAPRIAHTGADAEQSVKGTARRRRAELQAALGVGPSGLPN